MSPYTAMMSPAQKVSSAYQETEIRKLVPHLVCVCVCVHVKYLHIHIWGALSRVIVVQSHHPPGRLVPAEASPALLWNQTQTEGQRKGTEATPPGRARRTDSVHRGAERQEALFQQLVQGLLILGADLRHHVAGDETRPAPQVPFIEAVRVFVAVHLVNSWF